MGKVILRFPTIKKLELNTTPTSQAQRKKKGHIKVSLTQGHGSNLDAHQQTNGQGSCGTYTPWNITQPLKRIHLNQF